jgi:ubiquinone/menaquinone biosynthesis C-methylase UbiE
MTVAWPWERLEQSNADSHDLLVELLDPQAGERFLDVGSGSGGVARRAVGRGCEVVGVDIAEEAVEAAREAVPGARFEVADASGLPFEDAAFDIVASAFGVNFASDHATAAAELARVCRPGGRLGLTVMPPDSRAAALWTLVREYHAAGDHPGFWRAEPLEEWFDIVVQERQSPSRERFTPEERWEFARERLGFVRDVLSVLDADERETFRQRFLSIAAEYEDQPLRSSVILGRRRTT